MFYNDDNRRWRFSPYETPYLLQGAMLAAALPSIPLLEQSSSDCKGRATSELAPEGPYRVNGTNINFQSACFNGDKVIAAV